MEKTIKLSEPVFNKRIADNVLKVLKSKIWVQSGQVELLENKISKITNSKYAIAVSSGTAALHTILKSLELKGGDEVITTPFTFVATVNAIVLAGGKPVFADIDKYFNIDPKEVENKITNKTKAILAVDLYGQLADYSRLKKISKKYKIKLFSDSAQSLGAKHNKNAVSSFVDAAIFSLYGSKNISSGEGGLIVTNDSDLNTFSKVFINQGQVIGQKYNYEAVGLNYRLSDISASIANGQLFEFSKIIKKRKKIFNYYLQRLKDIREITLPEIMEGNESAYHQFTLRVNPETEVDRDKLASAFKKNNIQVGIYYPVPLHLVKHLEYLNYRKGDFPKAEACSREALSLPIHFYINDRDLEIITDTIIKIFKK